MTEKRQLPTPSLPVILDSEKIIKPKIDPIYFPSIRDVYQPKKSEETVRFSPLTGEIYIYGRQGKNDIKYVDNLVPEPGIVSEKVWFGFNDISDAYDFLKDSYLERGLGSVVNYTEDLVQRILPFLPQFSPEPLDEKNVKELFTDAFGQLIKPRDQLPSFADGQDLAPVLDSLMHNWRGIRRHRYPDFLTRSHLGWEFLDHFFRILSDQDKGENFSLTLATVLTEQYMEGGVVSSIRSVVKRAIDANAGQGSIQKTYRSLKEMMETIDLRFFKVAPYRKQAAYLIAELKGFGKDREGFFKELLGESDYQEVMEDWKINGGANNSPMALLQYIEHYFSLPDITLVKQRMVQVLEKVEPILIN